MGNSSSKNMYVSFEDVQMLIKTNNRNVIMIHTLKEYEEHTAPLIQGTLCVSEEMDRMNNLLMDAPETPILIYGKNADDESVYKKEERLYNQGFTTVYVYRGGIFEWLLLQDIFGEDEFPTVREEVDILKYKSKIKTPILRSNTLLLQD